jgi:anti-anti-sigma factor
VTDSSDYFKVRVDDVGGEPAVVVEGEIDLRAAGPFWDVVSAALATRPPRLVIDLADTTFMDSSGLEVLLRAHVALGRLPEAVVLRAPPPTVRRVLDLAGIESLFSYDGDADREPGGDDPGGDDAGGAGRAAP